MPPITELDSIFIGSYYFEITGSILEDTTTFESEGLVFDVVIAYKESNEGPFLVEEPTSIIVERNSTSTYNLGEIVDKENDRVFLAEWSINSNQQYSWVTFNNASDQNSLSFEFAPPDNAVLEILEIKFSLQDDNPYKGSTDYSLFVEIIEE